MTQKDIVESCARTYAAGVRIAMQGTHIENYILERLIRETYIKAFEDGIVFKQWGTMPNEFNGIKTDECFYDDYAKKDLELNLNQEKIKNEDI